MDIGIVVGVDIGDEILLALVVNKNKFPLQYPHTATVTVSA